METYFTRFLRQCEIQPCIVWEDDISDSDICLNFYTIRKLRDFRTKCNTEILYVAFDFLIVLIKFRKCYVPPILEQIYWQVKRHEKCFASIREDLSFKNLSYNI